jgi:hypothetical protein
MKQPVHFALFLLLIACFPTKIAPKIDNYIIKEGSKFHKDLLDHYAFIFNDPKDAFHFYNYINIVYELNQNKVDLDVPFVVNDQLFFFSFYEVEKTTNVVNLVPIVVDAQLDREGYGPFFESTYQSRTGHWYILINVFDEQGNDALHPAHAQRDTVKRYLNDLRKNYINNENYYEVLLNKNPD